MAPGSKSPGRPTSGLPPAAVTAGGDSERLLPVLVVIGCACGNRCRLPPTGDGWLRPLGRHEHAVGDAPGVLRLNHRSECGTKCCLRIGALDGIAVIDRARQSGASMLHAMVDIDNGPMKMLLRDLGADEFPAPDEERVYYTFLFG
jgi:hypothetical protein